MPKVNKQEEKIPAKVNVPAGTLRSLIIDRLKDSALFARKINERKQFLDKLKKEKHKSIPSFPCA
jgi:hypothetical protein